MSRNSNVVTGWSIAAVFGLLMSVTQVQIWQEVTAQTQGATIVHTKVERPDKPGVVVYNPVTHQELSDSLAQNTQVQMSCWFDDPEGRMSGRDEKGQIKRYFQVETSPAAERMPNKVVVVSAQDVPREVQTKTPAC